MDIGYIQSYSGMKIQEEKLEIIANNLANINTPGFKADVPFVTTLKKSLDNQSFLTQVPNLTNYTDLKEGELSKTENPLDVAIVGHGFFCVKTPAGLAYTRNGTFFVDGDGYLVTNNGERVQGKSGDIKITGKKIVIDQTGNILVDGFSQETLKIVDFSDYTGLEKIGEGLLMPALPNLKEIPAKNFIIKEGFKEESNVNPVKMMVEMIEILRRFQIMQKSLSSLKNDIDRKVIEQVGRLKP